MGPPKTLVLILHGEEWVLGYRELYLPWEKGVPVPVLKRKGVGFWASPVGRGKPEVQGCAGPVPRGWWRGTLVLQGRRSALSALWKHGSPRKEKKNREVGRDHYWYLYCPHTCHKWLAIIRYSILLLFQSQTSFSCLNFPPGNQNSERVSGLKSQIDSEETDQENELKLPKS